MPRAQPRQDGKGTIDRAPVADRLAALKSREINPAGRETAGIEDPVAGSPSPENRCS